MKTITRCLEESARPMTAAEIAVATGLKPVTVRRRLAWMAGRHWAARVVAWRLGKGPFKRTRAAYARAMRLRWRDES